MMVPMPVLTAPPRHHYHKVRRVIRLRRGCTDITAPLREGGRLHVLPNEPEIIIH